MKYSDLEEHWKKYVIERELKDWVWQFNSFSRLLTIFEKHPGEVPDRVPVLTLDEQRIMSLFRFFVRLAQKSRIAETRKWRLKVREIREACRGRKKRN